MKERKKVRKRERGNMKWSEEPNWGEYWLNIPVSKTSGVMIKLKLKSEKLKCSFRHLDHRRERTGKIET